MAKWTTKCGNLHHKESTIIADLRVDSKLGIIGLVVCKYLAPIATEVQAWVKNGIQTENNIYLGAGKKEKPTDCKI